MVGEGHMSRHSFFSYAFVNIMAEKNTYFGSFSRLVIICLVVLKHWHEIEYIIKSSILITIIFKLDTYLIFIWIKSINKNITWSLIFEGVSSAHFWHVDDCLFFCHSNCDKIWKSAFIRRIFHGKMFGQMMLQPF